MSRELSKLRSDFGSAPYWNQANGLCVHVQTSDGTDFMVDRASMCISGRITTELLDQESNPPSEGEGFEPVEVDVDARTFVMIIDWCIRQRDNTADSYFTRDFFDVDEKQLILLARAAEYLDIPSLVEASRQELAALGISEDNGSEASRSDTSFETESQESSDGEPSGPGDMEQVIDELIADELLDDEDADVNADVEFDDDELGGVRLVPLVQASLGRANVLAPEVVVDIEP